MKRLTLLVVPFAMFLVPNLAGVQAPAAQVVDRPAEPNLVFDDDGGKVQFVPADLKPSAGKSFHGGAVMTSAQQVSIFLGSGWAETSVRMRQSQLGDLASSGGVQVAETRAHNVKLLRAAPHAEDFSDLNKSSLNDLDIQRKLQEMLVSKAIPAPSANTVYVVFLAPGVSSTLGGNKAGVDYAAYHNVVNLEFGEVRYVVVPFHPDSQRHTAAAARAFAETTLNPNGQGWF